MHIKANVYKLYCKMLRHKKILLTILETMSLDTYIRTYVPRNVLGIHVCTYIKDHFTSLPI